MEIFKKVAPKYEVSTAGNVKSFMRYREGRLLSPRPTRNGYLRVRLMIDGEQKMSYVHRLVALTFIPNPENKPCVNHKNGDKTDNRVENLEWCTRSENMRHAFATGLAAQGDACYNAKLTNEQVVYIRENPDDLTGTELAAQFGVTQTSIYEIQIGKTYKNAGGTVRQSKKPRVTDDVRAEIRRLYVKGSREFGVAPKTIFNIVHEA